LTAFLPARTQTIKTTYKDIFENFETQFLLQYFTYKYCKPREIMLKNTCAKHQNYNHQIHALNGKNRKIFGHESIIRHVWKFF
jgi:hypothetical protein